MGKMGDIIKVTHIIRPSNLGGAETMLKELLSAPEHDGLDLDCILIADRQNIKTLDEYAARKIKFIAVRRLADPLPYRPVANLIVVARLFFILRRRKDHIIHLHLNLAAVLGRLAAWLAGCRFVVETVNGECGFYESFFGRHIWFPLLGLRTSCYIAVSEYLRRYLRKYVSRPVAVVPNGLPENKPLPAAEARNRLGLPPEAFVVGYVGRLEPEKNVSTLLKAASRLPDTIWLIAGEGSLAAQLREEAAGMPDADIRFAGAVSEAWRFMTAFDVLCLPSLHESQGLVLLEAMRAGIAIIGSDVPGIAETLDGGRAGLLHPPQDYMALADHILALKNDAHLRGRFAKRQVPGKYSLAAMQTGLLHVYRKILRSSC